MCDKNIVAFKRQTGISFLNFITNHYLYNLWGLQQGVVLGKDTQNIEKICYH